MHKITIRMKSGSTLAVEADARCYTDSNGAGQRLNYVEDLTCFWPGRPGSGKRREIPPGLYDEATAQEEYWDAARAAYD